MKNLFCVSLIISSSLIYAQNNDSLYSRTYSNKFMYFGVFDNSVFQETDTTISGIYIYIDNQKIDSIGIRVTSFPKYSDGEIYFSGVNRKIPKGLYRLRDKYIKRVSNADIDQDGFSNMLTSTKSFRKIFLNNLISNDTHLILDLEKTLSKDAKWFDKDSKYVIDDFWINDKTLYFSLASCPTGCFDYTHYLFNIEEESLKEIKYIKSKEKVINDEFTCLELVDSTHHYVLGFSSHSNDSNCIGRWLFNDTVRRERKLLSMNHAYMVKAPEGYFDYEAPIMAGYDFINKQPSGINYRSSLDSKFNVIVPYKFNVHQELSMLKIFYDSLLTQQEISGFGKYELSVLRNLVFAKHNYKFESEFWQAYFNLFEFYRSE